MKLDDHKSKTNIIGALVKEEEALSEKSTSETN
jgi:hypothetical protein